MQSTKTLIIAEMAWAHDGSVDKAIQIMKAAKDAGADAIGIHITDLEDYMVPHYGSGEGRVSAGKEHLEIYGYLNRINLSSGNWKKFCHEARLAGIALCVMPNDHPSLQFSEARLNPDFYVLSPASFVEEGFISAVATTNRHTFLRVGGATLGEIEVAINIFKRCGRGGVTLLHGFQNYPTKLEDTNIRQIAALAELFGVPVGLADHIDGGNPIAKTVPVVALALGATCLEKHITWDREEKGEDFEAALNPSDFREFVANVRAAEIALGNAHWGPMSPAAERYRNVSRKRMVAARFLEKGTILTRECIAFKRSDVGISPAQLEAIIGRTLKTDLHFNDGITAEDLL